MTKKNLYGKFDFGVKNQIAFDPSKLPEKIHANWSAYQNSAETWLEDVRGHTGVNAQGQMIAFSNELNKRFGEGSVVYDFGCGLGSHCSYFVSRGHRYVGIDFSQKVIDLARRDNPDGEFIVADISDFEAEQEADGVWCVATLYHMPSELLTNIFRIMRKSLKTRGLAHIMHYLSDSRVVDGEKTKVYEEPAFFLVIGFRQFYFGSFGQGRVLCNLQVSKRTDLPRNTPSCRIVFGRKQGKICFFFY